MTTNTATTTTTTTPRQRRRDATTTEIVAAAWELCHEGGLASLSLRELAARVGLRAPSLYSYFDSKDAIYDAMFRDGQEQLHRHMAPFRNVHPVTRDMLKAGTRHWFDFCVADPVRYQLLFQRTLPGFQPSPESYRLAVENLDEAGAILRAAGVTEPAALDLWTAILTGLTSQQIANDPGGHRWTALVDDAIDMFLDHIHRTTNPTTNEPTTTEPGGTS